MRYNSRRDAMVWIIIFTAIIFFSLLIISGWTHIVFYKIIMAVFSYLCAWGLYAHCGSGLKKY